MTKHKHIAAGALLIALAGSAAFAAHNADQFVCQTWNQAKTGRTVAHCVTWNRETGARMRAVNCNPAMISEAAMRLQCATMEGEPRKHGPAPSGS
ncbi:MAG TPA: hypothetical protein VG166_03140 [Caulobacteraceae bacterium]|jgi:hypothetical protein|nr:hypothetical protein [Caulobacteraceae bacterium]